MLGKKKVAALFAEFLGTAVLTVLILSVQRSQIGLQFFVAIGAGLTIAMLTFIVGSSSGGYFNPAITIGMWTARKLSTVRAIVYLIAQFLGGYAALGIYTYFSNTHLSSVGGHYTGRILIAEAIGTGVFSFGYMATLYKGYSEPVRSAFAGLSYTMGVIIASSAALGLLNPAVALGIKSWVWGTYVLGPIVGAVIGMNLYAVLFAETEDITFIASSVTVAAVAAPAAISSKAVKPTVVETSAKKKAPVTKKKTTTKKR
jgi:aquaporin Z